MKNYGRLARPEIVRPFGKPPDGQPALTGVVLTHRSPSSGEGTWRTVLLSNLRTLLWAGRPKMGLKYSDNVYGVNSVNAMFACEDPGRWRRVYGKYWEVVEAKSALKGKKSGKLLPLEKWYQEELPALISSRPDRYVTLSELVKLMEWKLTRGKFRPRLQQMVATNGAEVVEKCSRKAFGLLPDVRAAITELSSLKAVGPATASAVLAAGSPERAAFMSDEGVGSVPGLTPIQYTAKHYDLYLSKMIERTKKLNKVDSEKDWTPHRAELCLWARQLQLPLLEDEVDEDGSGGRESPESDADKRPTKKRKTK
ncbi:hypothetical protein N1851_001555 [Merluccius polli]|uniref:Uncharacterized protein n=1 Tax=Merluccius polli TaxID=89951 RepID=A0AA47PCT5_MERPO|nr:hypothetical protein N1851_001555 [Merluccius polli]